MLVQHRVMTLIHATVHCRWKFPSSNRIPTTDIFKERLSLVGICHVARTERS